MGIYDRDYEREQNYGGSSGFQLGGGVRSLTTNLVIVMAIVYVVQLFTKVSDRDPGWFTDTFSLWANLPRQPWMAFQLITYGFLHSPNDITHILFNCFGLWMFGRIVEMRYGQREYLTFFLAAVAFAGLAWVVSELVANQRMLPNASLLGASGGIAAVLILFCVNYPRQRVFIWGVLPIPAWVFAIMFVGYDLFHASKGSSASAEGDSVAYTAHIGGVIFALVYYKAGWRLSDWVPSQMKMPKLRRRPPLRVHHPADEVDDTDDAVDVILRKIREHGQDSLTSQERRILQEASREYQKRRN